MPKVKSTSGMRGVTNRLLILYVLRFYLNQSAETKSTSARSQMARDWEKVEVSPMYFWRCLANSVRL